MNSFFRPSPPLPSEASTPGLEGDTLERQLDAYELNHREFVDHMSAHTQRIVSLTKDCVI